MPSWQRLPAGLLAVVGVLIALRGVRGYLAATPVMGPRIGYLLELGLLAHLLVGVVLIAIALLSHRAARPAAPAAVLAGVLGVWAGIRLDVFGRFPDTQVALALLAGVAVVAAVSVGGLVRWRVAD